MLGYWVAYVQNGVEVSDFPAEKFTEGAKKLASGKGIYLSSEKEIAALRKMLAKN